MRIVFSRKGFDSASGGGPSPIIEERPVSLPIPAGAASHTTYGDLGLGKQAAKASRGRFGAEDLCHHDPMFLPDGRCLFGQCGAAQTHLANQGVGVGDTFLFFGLFRKEDGAPHHRIFGYLTVEEVIDLSGGVPQWLRDRRHPHALAPHGRNDTVYVGPGGQARKADAALRLTVPEGPPSLWRIPSWLRQGGLTYHDRKERWIGDDRLQSVARGQEFVADIGENTHAQRWLAQTISGMG